MAWLTQVRLVIAYNNRVRPDLVTAVTANFTPDTGFGLTNLEYPDPTLVCRESDTSASDRQIVIQLSAAQTINCAGVLAHNLVTQGYEFVNVEHSPDGSTWTGVGTGTIAMTSSTNPNFLLRFTQQTTKTYWRFTFGRASGTRAAFEVGMLFLGSHYEFTRHSVTDGGYLIRRDAGANFVEAVGGQTWMGQGHSSFKEDYEIEITRAAALDSAQVQDVIYQNNIRRIIAIIPPDQVANQFPSGGQHSFGYLNGLVISPRGGFGSGDKYDMTFAMLGAV